MLTEELKRCVLNFGLLPEDELARIAAAVIEKQVVEQTLLFREGDEGGRFFILLEGQVEIIKALGTLDERRLAVREPCSMLGELSLFALQDYGGMRAVVGEFLDLVPPAHLVDVVFGFPFLSLLQLVEGEVEMAVEYYAYASSHAYIANSIWYQDLVERPIEKAAESLPPGVRAAAWERGLTLDPLKEIENLSIEFKKQAEGRGLD